MLAVLSLASLAAALGQCRGTMRLVENIDYNPEWTTSWLYGGKPNASEYYVITNPGFPYTACDPFEQEIDASEYLFYLVMLDYDLPENTMLQVWVGPWSTVSWTVWNGKLMRLVRTSKGYLRVVYTPPDPCEDGANVGFKLLLWYGDPAAEYKDWKPRPWPRCPAYTGTEDGGKQVLGIGNPPVPGEAFHDCIWQLKLPHFPDSREKWFIYARITDMFVVGTVEIREGLNSDALLLASNGHHIPESYFLTSLGQPAEGFTSSQGLYIRLIKPFWEGNFTFIYGYFTHQQTLPERCYHHIANETFQEGFLCKGTSWCIPYQHTCNDVMNCVDGSDENLKECIYVPGDRQPVYVDLSAASIHSLQFKLVLFVAVELVLIFYLS